MLGLYNSISDELIRLGINFFDVELEINNLQSLTLNMILYLGMG